MCNCNNGRKMNSCPSFTANAMLVGDCDDDGEGGGIGGRGRGGGSEVVDKISLSL